MHQYRCVALYEANILQKGRFRAAFLASSSSISSEVRSPLMFLSQERGRPGGLLQSSGRGSNSIRFAAASPSIQAIYQNNERCLLTWWWMKVDVVQSCDRYHHFWLKSCHRMLRIHWRHHRPNASVRNMSALLTVQHSDPQSIIGNMYALYRRSCDAWSPKMTVETRVSWPFPPLRIWNFKNPRWWRPPSWKIENWHISATVWAISTKYGTVTQFDLFDRCDC